MITGAHAILFSRDADADRAFLADVLGLGSVDAGGGWLLFAMPPSELAVHPTDGDPAHQLYLMCEDVDAFLADLADRGVELGQPVSDEGWGRLASFRLPSGAEQFVYEPRHPLAHGDA